VIFLVFNRPAHTRLVFAEIAKARPPKMLIVADGPRPDRPGDAVDCSAVRDVVERVDWDCEVLRNYSDVNLGCGRRVSSGLTWAFEHVEEAVVLEDDIVPDPTFFRFCDELLERYRDDERVMHVSGNNFGPAPGASAWSYHFSRYDHIWGWATWRRAFRCYDFTMALWPSLRTTTWLSDLLADPVAADWWRRHFDMATSGNRSVHDAWSTQWVFAMWAQNGLSITPAVNLTSNIGFGAEATHTKDRGSFGDLRTFAMTFPLVHPPYMIRDRQADDLAFEVACQPVRRRAESSLDRWVRRLRG
jgi:hypothetical protein